MGSYRIAILCVGEVSLHTALLAAEPFRAANRLGQGSPFEIDFVAPGGGELQTMIGIPLPTRAINDLRERFDLVFVLACYETEAVDKTRVFAWLRNMRQKGALIAGLDFAPVLMAEAGLLANRRATSHWSTLGAFSECHADVEVEEALYVIDGSVATCAGQIAALDLSMALLKRVVAAGLYQAVQDELIYRTRDADRETQRRSPAENSMLGDRAMTAARSVMEGHIEDPVSVEAIAKRAGLSQRELQRRFRQQLGRSPIEFYREIRLKRALNLLQYSKLSIREVGIATGFADPSTFYRAVRERFQKGPQELRASFHSGASSPNGRRTGFDV